MKSIPHAESAPTLEFEKKYKNKIEHVKVFNSPLCLSPYLFFYFSSHWSFVLIKFTCYYWYM